MQLDQCDFFQVAEVRRLFQVQLLLLRPEMSILVFRPNLRIRLNSKRKYQKAIKN